jgi:NosR/NirI family nitrous oxide reductase transcriptional regulator
LNQQILIGLLALLAMTGAAGPAVGATRAPERLDCSSMPCAAVFPAAQAFQPVAGATHWEAVDASGEVIGWLALSTDLVDIKAYSGKPLVTLVGLDPKGVITGARVIHHSEPILLIGIPEQALHDFVDFYAGQPALQRIVVGRADKPDTISVDAVSGATVTVLAQNITVLDTARRLGILTGVFEEGTTTTGHFVQEPVPWTFGEMLERGALGHLAVSHQDMGVDETQDAFVDLYFGVADAPHIGRALLGERNYTYYHGRLEPGEHLLVVINSGSESFKGSAFVRGGIFDRIRLQQGLREITFRDTDYWNLSDLAVEDAPEFNEGALFVLRAGRFDPGTAYDLVFLGSRYDQRGAFTRDFREFTEAHQLPKSVYIVDPTSSGIPWRQAWSNRRADVVVLCAYLAFVLAVFVVRRRSTANAARLDRFHVASLVVAFVVLGIGMGAQPSVTQILTVVGSLLHDWRWDLFLSEPLIFVSWLFIAAVTVIWGRGVFCGWVCPYGALNELVFRIGKRMGVRSYELPDRIHGPLRHLRYVILAGLIGVYLWDSILGERLAEVEPFKSTFLVPFWNREWFYALWWLVLLGTAVVVYRPFCRYLCPLGGGLALASSLRPSGPRRRAFCSSCQICTRGCEPRAIRPDGTIDSRECLSCMECEATYRDDERCPPLLGLAALAGQSELTARELEKRERLQLDVVDV